LASKQSKKHYFVQRKNLRSMKKISFLLLVYILMFNKNLFAQKDPLLYTYPHNTLALNPAYAGSKGIASLQVINRRQTFTQLGGSASTYISYQTPLAKKANSFLGLQAYNAAGGIRTLGGNGLAASTGYRHHITDSVSIAFSAQYNLTQKLTDANNFGNTSYKSDIGAGVYLRSLHSYLGASKPFLSKLNQFGDTNPMYILAGHVFHVNPKMALKTGAVYETNYKKLDLHAQAWFNQKYSLGLYYNQTGSEERNDKALIVNAESQLNKKFRLGISYDFAARNAEQNQNGTTTLNQQIYGLFQLNLLMEFDNLTGKIERFRYF
jgi:type IX secretion system PorP/SprF family membrane protein